VENAAISTRAVKTEKIDLYGFPTWLSYHNWLEEGPVVLELNRDVQENEEIIISYQWSSLEDVIKKL
jgi:hypothetical protein